MKWEAKTKATLACLTVAPHTSLPMNIWAIQFVPSQSKNKKNCSKDVRLPVQLQRAMAAEAEAAREARAKVR